MVDDVMLQSILTYQHNLTKMFYVVMVDDVIDVGVVEERPNILQEAFVDDVDVAQEENRRDSHHSSLYRK